jgi:PKD repeat protein
MYVSYTTLDEHAQLSRLTVQNGTANLTSEVVYMKGNQLQNPHHGANDLYIGPDKNLWWTVGDNVPSITNAQTLVNIYGKILRFNLNGTIPQDNPFLNIPKAVPAIYAYGLRNPFRFTFLPNGKAMEADTGSSFWEELNTIQAGGNYGWDFVEGNCGSCGAINPVYAYGHLPVDGAVSAIAAYSGNAFPQQYSHVVFFGDYNRRDIEAVTFDKTYSTEISDKVFDSNAGTIADLREGPDGSLYYVSIFEGTFTKISPNGPFTPVAAASVDTNAGLAPLTVHFSSAGSSDPYGAPLTYSWNFADGTPASTDANPSHMYTQNGKYIVTLTVSSGSQTSTATTQVVVGYTAPQAAITSPAVSATYNGGDTISFSGTATDAVDGVLPASAYTWQADFYNNGVAQPFYTSEVAHPFYGQVTGVKSGSFQIPQDVSITPSTYYCITMTVVNSLGIKTVVTRDIHPNATTLSINTNIPGAAYMVDGTWHTGPYSAQDVPGVQHVLAGVPTQMIGGIRYRFQGWSDGNALTDSFTDTTAGKTVTANYETVQNSVPAPWQSVDVGTPLMAGRADYSANSNSFYVDGAGADVAGNNDQFHYVYQPLNGNGTIIARVRYQTVSSPWAKAGIMIKESAVAKASYVDALVTPDVSPATPNINGTGCNLNGCASPLPPVTPAFGYGVRMQYNFTGSKSVTSATALAGYNAPNKWLKLQRVGNTFTSWYSTDGSTWKLIGNTTVTMNATATIGLFVTAHNIGQYSAAAFDNVSVIPGP